MGRASPRPQPVRFLSRRLDRTVCKVTRYAVRGVPTLVWDVALPKWFVPTVNLENAKRVLLGHISTVAGHYAGQMYSWDVVNEGIEIGDGRADGLKVTPWLIYLGPEYIDLAFHAAHQADPQAMLVYNENRLEPESSVAKQRRQSVLSLLTRLVKRGVPIHGLGIQSHLLAETNVAGPGFKRFLHAIDDLGLSILITEMDVRDHLLPGDIAVRDGLVAKQYYNYLSFILQFKSVEAVLPWGLSDRSTWLSKYRTRAKTACRSGLCSSTPNCSPSPRLTLSCERLRKRLNTDRKNTAATKPEVPEMSDNIVPTSGPQMRTVRLPPLCRE